jgi:hypothetical protein
MIDGPLNGLRRHGVFVLTTAGIALVAGCGGAAKGSETAHAVEAARPEQITHEPCGEGQGSLASMDVNGDGKPDIQRVASGGRELCRIVDLDHDGKPDLYEYFNSDGSIRRREFCYDQAGTVNAIEYYEGGKLVRREYDVGGHHKIDTWDWFDPNSPLDAKTGRPVHPIRRERDSSGSGTVDQWWTWNGDQVTISYDRTGAGRPDPATSITLGPDGNPISTNGGGPPGSKGGDAGTSFGSSTATIGTDGGRS